MSIGCYKTLSGTTNVRHWMYSHQFRTTVIVPGLLRAGMSYYHMHLLQLQVDIL